MSEALSIKHTSRSTAGRYPLVIASSFFFMPRSASPVAAASFACTRACHPADSGEIMLTYSSYFKKRSNLVGTNLVAGFANSSFEILAGIGVFATLGYMAHVEGVSVSELDDIASVDLSFVTFHN